MDQTRQANFTVSANLFSREIHTATVGILGAGRIGLEAKLYQGLGARVLAYDPRPSATAQATVTVVPLSELLAQSDIVSVTCRISRVKMII